MSSAPRLLLFAGPNGSGKSTVTTPETLARFGIPVGRYINADDIAQQMVYEMPDAVQEEREREAFRRARALRQTYREDGVSFAFETVFSHPSTLLDMQKCRAAGFEVVLLFVTTSDAEINVFRVAGRVRSGGHAVPEDRIRSRYERVMTLLPRIVEEADRAFVYDNSGRTPRIWPFHGGQVLPSTEPLPVYLQERLLMPLLARRAERTLLGQHLGSVSLPDEEKGASAGTVRWTSTHYLAQEVTGGGALLRHDLLLQENSSGDIAEVGSPVIIHYREGAGTIVG